MHILYVSRLCSDDKFNELFQKGLVTTAQQQQKFHSLFAKGLQAECDALLSISTIPKHETKNILRSFGNVQKEFKHGINFTYLSLFNLPIIRHMLVSLWSFVMTLFWSFKHRKSERVIICDVLNVSLTMGTLLAAILTNIPTLGIVTDLPDFLQSQSRSSNHFLKRVYLEMNRISCNFIIQQYRAYIVLTEQMNTLINPKNKPSIVIEGMVDSTMELVSNPILASTDKIIIYAGALHEKYGLKTLLYAFLKVHSENARLWIYGSGDFESEIRRLSQADNRISYFGTVANSIVVEAELAATLLINPRPSNEAYTMYSFPSKNMEYMVSGTPLLTTPLPGMPKEYYDHVFIIENETIEGLASKLTELLNTDPKTLRDKGSQAKQFVITHKNNLVQANRAVRFILENLIPRLKSR